MKAIFNTRNKMEIESADDFELVASDIFTEFLETFTKEDGLIRDVEEDDIVDESIQFVYTDKGQALAERMLDRLHKVGNKHFGEVEIRSSLYIEF